MKDIYKNPIFYYILIPCVLALWPLLVWGFYIPKTESIWNANKAKYVDAEKLITEILTLDPDRLQFSDPKVANKEFDYTIAVEKVASICGIESNNYKISSGMIITSSGQKNQSAKVVLKEVDITQFAKFLSTIQFRWPNLQCEKVKLTKKKGQTDAWAVDLDFKYYF